MDELRQAFPDSHSTLEDQIAEGDEGVKQWSKRLHEPALAFQYPSVSGCHAQSFTLRTCARLNALLVHLDQLRGKPL